MLEHEQKSYACGSPLKASLMYHQQSMSYSTLLEHVPREIAQCIVEYNAPDPDKRNPLETHWWIEVDMKFDLCEGPDGRTFLEKLGSVPGVVRSFETYKQTEDCLFHLAYHESSLLLYEKSRRQILLNREWRHLRLQTLICVLRLARKLRLDHRSVANYLQELYEISIVKRRRGAVGLSNVTDLSWSEAIRESLLYVVRMR